MVGGGIGYEKEIYGIVVAKVSGVNVALAGGGYGCHGTKLVGFQDPEDTRDKSFARII
jgi:hypothetical protein